MLDPSRSFSATQSVLYYGEQVVCFLNKTYKVLELEIYGLLAATAL